VTIVALVFLGGQISSILSVVGQSFGDLLSQPASQSISSFRAG